jgi:hypothetical protein
MDIHAFFARLETGKGGGEAFGGERDAHRRGCPLTLPVHDTIAS